jgi:uncharacterized protein YdaU (DUF1376 family)
MRWYKHDPSAFLEGVFGLTAEERGFYITLIDLLYARDGHDVRDELVCSAMACNPRTWRAVKRRLIACGKVREVDGKLTANRVERTLNEARMKGQLGATSFEINELQKEQKSPRVKNLESFFPTAATPVNNPKRVAKKQQGNSARSLASAQPSGALTREPDNEPAEPKKPEEMTLAEINAIRYGRK